MGAFGAGARGEAAESRDTGVKVDGESNEIGSEPRGQREDVGTGDAGIKKFVAEKNDGKKQRRLLAEKGGKEEECAEEKRRERSGGRAGAVVKDHGEEKEDGALKFGEGGDPGDGFGVDGMKSEPEGGPEGEEGGVEGSDKQIHEGHDNGVQEEVNEVPADGMLAKELEFGGVGEELEGTIVVGADVGFVTGLASEVPNFSGENLAEIFAFEDDGILEDLEFVVGDEVVAEGGGV